MNGDLGFDLRDSQDEDSLDSRIDRIESSRNSRLDFGVTDDELVVECDANVQVGIICVKVFVGLERMSEDDDILRGIMGQENMKTSSTYYAIHTDGDD